MLRCFWEPQPLWRQGMILTQWEYCKSYGLFYLFFGISSMVSGAVPCQQAECGALHQVLHRRRAEGVVWLPAHAAVPGNPQGAAERAAGAPVSGVAHKRGSLLKITVMKNFDRGGVSKALNLVQYNRIEGFQLKTLFGTKLLSVWHYLVFGKIQMTVEGCPLFVN